jgi:hypothetical protein
LNVEDLIQDTNSTLFLREFSFNQNKFIPEDNHELELADNLVVIDTNLIVYQLKERALDGKFSRNNNWYRANIRDKAVEQIDNTHSYLDKYAPIKVENDHGISTIINKRSAYNIFSVICYKCANKISIHKKSYYTNTSGFIHVFTLEEYNEIAKIFITMMEIIEYLEFRENIIIKFPKACEVINERFLIGQYLSNNIEHEPTADFFSYYDKLVRQEPIFKNILRLMRDRLYPPKPDNEEYQKILLEFNKQDRTTLMEIDRRFRVCRDFAREGKSSHRIMRIFNPRTQCGFAFSLLDNEVFTIRHKLLLANTELAKYSLKAEKIIGVSFIFKDNYLFIDWVFIEHPWIYSEEIECSIKENDFFSILKDEMINRYKYERD